MRVSVVAGDLTDEQACHLSFDRAISAMFGAADQGIGFNDQIFSVSACFCSSIYT